MTTVNLVRARHKGQPAAGVPLWRLIPPHRFRTSTPEPTPLAPGQERPVRPGWLNQCIHCWGWYDDPRHTPDTAGIPQTGVALGSTASRATNGAAPRGLAPAAPSPGTGLGGRAPKPARPAGAVPPPRLDPAASG